ncbi:MAG: hypothetical protein LLF94_06910 [Chlamydiales bacterium]|nr:hypothetical protein [Chlamydiales bacterium]
MKGLSQTRIIIYSLILGCIPLLLVYLNYSSDQAKQNSLSYMLSDAIQEATNKNAREFVNKQVRAQFRDSNHFYIDQEIETISPLKDEVQSLQKILSSGFHANEDAFRRRLQFHTSGQNAISFVEGSVKAYPGFQETQESLAHSVEVDSNDIKAILSRIEGVQFNEQNPVAPLRPHLFITDWKMEKKKGATQEVYVLDVKLVKREYLK